MIDVLLLEDDPAKKARLLTFLDLKKGVLFGRVDTALCTSDALSRLKDHQYDLLIADVVVPAALGGEPNESFAVELFNEIDEGVGGLLRPKYTVAVSASEGLLPQSKDFFVGRPWGILKYDESNDEFLTTIHKICEFIVTQKGQIAVARSCDVCVITALLEPEFSAVENSGVSWSALEPLDSTQFIRLGKIVVDGEERTVAAAFAPRMGPVSSAVLTAKVVLQLKPKLIVMSGICAGIPGKANIGDVVAADPSWDWQSGKFIDKNGDEVFEIAPHQVPIDDRLRPALTLLKRDEEFWNSLAPDAVKAGTALPRMVVGPLASGSAVLADSRVSDRIKSTQHRNVTGLDMEVYGVYAAAQACDPEMKFIALKAVCDNGDRQKDDKYQEYAAKVSAAATVRFIQKYAGGFLRD
jgi:nucleoside phosphorylase